MKPATARAAILDRDGDVIGRVDEAPATGYSIKIAGTFTASGDPVNVREYRISRSKRNLEKAAFEQPVIKVGDVWTFHAVENDQVLY